jgi:hypothetical protein
MAMTATSTEPRTTGVRMAGPEHYIEAERLLARAKGEARIAAETTIAEAAVHATLAQAAAAGLLAAELTVQGQYGRHYLLEQTDRDAWTDAVAVQP